MQKCVETGVQVNARNEKGYHTVHMAALSGDPDILNLILVRDHTHAFARSRSRTRTRSHHCQHVRHVHSHTLSLSQGKIENVGAVINLRDWGGFTALHFAANWVSLSYYYFVEWATERREDERRRADVWLCLGLG